MSIDSFQGAKDNDYIRTKGELMTRCYEIEGAESVIDQEFRDLANEISIEKPVFTVSASSK